MQIKYKTSIFPWILYLVGAAFYCYEYFLRILPSVITADLMQLYHISAASLGNLVAFYYYAYTPMQLPVGILMDRYRIKSLLTFACMLCVIGTYLFIVNNNFYIAAVGRFLVGFGSAFAFVGVLKIATIWLPDDKFAFVSGLTTTLGMLGGMFGTVLLTKLFEHTGIHSIVSLTSISGFILIALILIFVTDKKGNKDRNVTQQLMTLAQAFRGFFRILLNYQIWLIGIVGALFYTSLTVFAEFWGIQYLMQAHHCTPMQAAQAVSMVFLGWAVGSPVSGWLSDRIKRRINPMIIGAILACVSISIVLFSNELPLYLIYIALFSYGLFCSVQVVVFALGKEHSPLSLSGSAVAITNMLVMLSGMLLQPFLGWLLDFKWTGQIVNNVPYYGITEYRFALSILPVGMLVAFVLLFFIKETYAKSQIKS